MYHHPNSFSLKNVSFSFELKFGSKLKLEHGSCLNCCCSRGSYVGIDPTLISEITWQKWGKELATRESKLVPVSQNLGSISSVHSLLK